ncbi:MAG: response regulator transcription factor [Leptolyngbyaceae bacterium]|nr:response regulator transcription factor [Leptolyngbyaceae bacterium]
MTVHAKTKHQALNVVDSWRTSRSFLDPGNRQRQVSPLQQKPLSGTLLRVLLIVSDVALARFIQLELEHEGYEVSLSFDGVSGFAAVQSEYPDLIVVDWALAGLSATEFCRYLRSNSYQTPLIMLTEMEQVGDRIASLNSGADDCLTKPFQMDELRAKVRAHFRRIGRGINHILRFADLILDTRAREVRRNGTSIYFTAREFDLLEYLMRHPNQVMSRTQILGHVWGHDFEGESNVVEVYIRNLRQKLEQHQAKRLIQTMRGVGYVLREG